MKEYKQKPILVLKLEKDQEDNLSGMQARVWKLNNGTTIVLRLYEHSRGARDHLWDGKKTLDQVCDLMLKILEKFRVIKDAQNWEYSVDNASNFCVQDEFEEKGNCYYFSWVVQSSYLKF